MERMKTYSSMNKQFILGHTLEVFNPLYFMFVYNNSRVVPPKSTTKTMDVIFDKVHVHVKEFFIEKNTFLSIAYQHEFIFLLSIKKHTRRNKWNKYG